MIKKPKKPTRRRDKKIAVETAKKICRMQGDDCERCGKTGIQIHAHHIIPLAMGSTNEWVAAYLRNLIRLCAWCHRLGPDSAHQHAHSFVKWLDDYAPGLYEHLQKVNQTEGKVDWNMVKLYLKSILKELEG